MKNLYNILHKFCGFNSILNLAEICNYTSAKKIKKAIDTKHIYALPLSEHECVHFPNEVTRPADLSATTLLKSIFVDMFR